MWNAWTNNKHIQGYLSMILKAISRAIIIANVNLTLSNLKSYQRSSWDVLQLMREIARSEQQSPPSRNLRIRSLLGHSADNIVSHAHREQGLSSPSAPIQSSLTHSADNIVTTLLSILRKKRLESSNIHEKSRTVLNTSKLPQECSFMYWLSKE